MAWLLDVAVAKNVWAAASPLRLHSLLRRYAPVAAIERLSNVYSDTIPEEQRALREAHVFNREDVFFWLVDKYEITKARVGLLNGAMLGRSPKIARWALDHLDKRPYSRHSYIFALLFAYQESKHEMVKFLESFGPYWPREIWAPVSHADGFGFDILRELCSSGNTDSARQIVKRYEFDARKSGARNIIGAAFRAACRGGHLKTVKWLTKRFRLVGSQALPDIVIGSFWYSSVKLARWIIGRFQLSEVRIENGMLEALASDNEEHIMVFRQLAADREMVGIWTDTMRTHIVDLEGIEKGYLCKLADISAKLAATKQTKAKFERLIGL